MLYDMILMAITLGFYTGNVVLGMHPSFSATKAGAQTLEATHWTAVTDLVERSNMYRAMNSLEFGLLGSGSHT